MTTFKITETADTDCGAHTRAHLEVIKQTDLIGRHEAVDQLERKLSLTFSIYDQHQRKLEEAL